MCRSSQLKQALWFAFKLVSLSHWIQRCYWNYYLNKVVICFQISIFEPLNTAHLLRSWTGIWLWFAFKLVSLSHWIQPQYACSILYQVVICFQISIFEPLNTADDYQRFWDSMLWFAFKLVSLSHWIQQKAINRMNKLVVICFQISIFEPLNTAYTNISASALCCDLLSN